MELLVRLGVMLSLLGVGFLARQTGLLGSGRRDRLNAVAFYVVLPALVFDKTYDQSLREIFSVELVAGLWLVLFGTVAVSLLVHRRIRSRPVRSVATVQSYHGNLAYIGLPLVALTLGDAAAARASLILGVAVLTQVPLTVALLVSLNDADAAVADEVRGVLTNPVVASLAVGLLVSYLSLPVPEAVGTATGLVSEAALPVALLLVGSALEFDLLEADVGTMGTVVGLKVFLMPVLAWVAFTVVGAAPLARNAGVVMFGAPTAVSTFIYAKELGGDAGFASVTVFATTVVSMLTLGAGLQLLL